MTQQTENHYNQSFNGKFHSSNYIQYNNDMHGMNPNVNTHNEYLQFVHNNYQHMSSDYTPQNNHSHMKKQFNGNAMSCHISPDNAKKRKQFIEREGDWVCMRCKNKNFSFRVFCNRCKIPKCESEILYNEHMQNLMNLVKMNEMVQNKIFSQQSFSPNMNVNRNSFNNFDPALFSPNSCPIYDQYSNDIFNDKRNGNSGFYQK